jgi:hypothetical protein
VRDDAEVGTEYAPKRDAAYLQPLEDVEMHYPRGLTYPFRNVVCLLYFVLSPSQPCPLSSMSVVGLRFTGPLPGRNTARHGSGDRVVIAGRRMYLANTMRRVGPNSCFAVLGRYRVRAY